METHQNCADAIKYDIPGLAGRIEELVAKAGEIEPPVWLGLTKSANLDSVEAEPDVHPADQVGRLWNALVPMIRRPKETALGRSHFKHLFRWSQDLELGRTAAAMVSSYNASVRRIVEDNKDDEERNAGLTNLFQGFRAWAASLDEPERWEIFQHAGSVSHNGPDLTGDGHLVRASFVFRVFPQETVRLFSEHGGGSNLDGQIVIPEAPQYRLPEQVQPVRVYIGAAGWRHQIRSKHLNFQQAVDSRNALIGRTGTLVRIDGKIGVDVDGRVELFVRGGQGEAGEQVLISPLSGNPWALTLSVIGTGPAPDSVPTVVVRIPPAKEQKKAPARKIGLVGIADRNRTACEVLQLIQTRQALVVNGIVYGPNLEELATLRASNVSLAEIETQFPDLSGLQFKPTARSLNAVL